MKTRMLFFLLVAVLAACSPNWELPDPLEGPDIRVKTSTEELILKSGQSITVEKGLIIFFFSTVDADTYNWNFGDASAQLNDKNTFHKYVNEGSYTLTFTVTVNGETSSSEILVYVVNSGNGDDGSLYLHSSSQQADGSWTYTLYGAKSKINSSVDDYWTNGDHTGWTKTSISDNGDWVVIPVTTYDDELEIHYGRGNTWNTAEGSQFAVQVDGSWKLKIAFRGGEIFPLGSAPVFSLPGIGDEIFRVDIINDTLYAYSNTSLAPTPKNKPFFHIWRNDTWELLAQTWLNGSGWGLRKIALVDLPQVVQLKFGGNSDVASQTYADISESVFFNTSYQALAFQLVQSDGGKAAGLYELTDSKTGSKYMINSL